MSAAAVEFRGVAMDFGDKRALHAVDLAVEAGSFLVLLGPSGSGKTTLLNILGGFLEPSAGSVWIEGRDVTGVAPAKRSTTTVFQDYALFPHMSVAGNVAFGLKMRGVARAERDRRVDEALALVGLAGRGRSKPHELSGGQRQRVALARALVVAPSVLLLDEPLGALDLKLRRQMQEELKAIQKRVGTTFVHVTHDQEEAMAIADRIVVMNDGRIEDEGAPERIYLQPASRFTAAFMGDNNIVAGRVAAVDGGQVVLETPLGRFELAGQAEPGSDAAFCLRPEHLHVEPGPGRQRLAEGQLLESGFFGTHHQGSLQVEGLPDPLRLRLPQRWQTKAEGRLTLYADPADMVLLTR
jgi:spermidine/putrescine transport system ATP-binding protein